MYGNASRIYHATSYWFVFIAQKKNIQKHIQKQKSQLKTNKNEKETYLNICVCVCVLYMLIKSNQIKLKANQIESKQTNAHSFSKTCFYWLPIIGKGIVIPSGLFNKCQLFKETTTQDANP